MTSPLCIRGGRILDPARGIDRVQDLWISGGKIGLTACSTARSPLARVTR